MSVKQLTEDIKNGTLASVYYIYGEEEYLKRTYFDQLKNAGAPELPEFNLIEINGRNFDLIDFTNSVNSYPMMSEHKVVAVTDFENDMLKKDFSAKLTETLKNVPDFCTVIFYDGELKRDKSNAALSKIMKNAGAVDVSVGHPSLSGLASWCIRHFKSGGKRADEAVLKRLFDRSGTDMLVLSNEIKKLCSGVDGEIITVADVDALATRNIEADRYRMIDAFCNSNYSELLSVIDDLYSQGVDDISIANVLYYAFLDLWHARETLDCRRSRAELVSVMGMRPFVADRTLRNARGLSARFLRKAMLNALELDVKLKSTSLNKRELITVFIADLVRERENG